jgi:hypothetical protein
MFSKWSSFTDILSDAVKVAEANIDKLVGIEEGAQKNQSTGGAESTKEFFIFLLWPNHPTLSTPV